MPGHLSLVLIDHRVRWSKIQLSNIDRNTSGGGVSVSENFLNIRQATRLKSSGRFSLWAVVVGQTKA